MADRGLLSWYARGQ